MLHAPVVLLGLLVLRLSSLLGCSEECLLMTLLCEVLEDLVKEPHNQEVVVCALSQVITAPHCQTFYGHLWIRL